MLSAQTWFHHDVMMCKILLAHRVNRLSLAVAVYKTGHLSFDEGTASERAGIKSLATPPRTTAPLRRAAFCAQALNEIEHLIRWPKRSQSAHPGQRGLNAALESGIVSTGSCSAAIPLGSAETCETILPACRENWMLCCYSHSVHYKSFTWVKVRK